MSLKKKKSDDDFAGVVESIEEENRAKLNDSVVSEDGCVYNEPLLAGYIDEDGILQDTFSFREMTGADEEAINKPDIASNGGRTMTTLVERCVFQIGSINKKDVGIVQWGKIIRSMLVGDLSYMMFKIRELSKGGVIQFTHTCPHCHTNIDTEVHTDEFSVIPFSGQHDVPFELSRGVKDRNGDYHKTGTFRLINGYDAEVVVPQFKKNQAKATTLLMSRILKFDDEGDGFKLNTNMVSNMTTKDRDTINGLVSDNKFGVELSIDIVCPNCGEYLTTQAGSSDFL